MFTRKTLQFLFDWRGLCDDCARGGEPSCWLSRIHEILPEEATGNPIKGVGRITHCLQYKKPQYKRKVVT